MAVKVEFIFQKLWQSDPKLQILPWDDNTINPIRAMGRFPHQKFALNPYANSIYAAPQKKSWIKMKIAHEKEVGDILNEDFNQWAKASNI